MSLREDIGENIFPQLRFFYRRELFILKCHQNDGVHISVFRLYFIGDSDILYSAEDIVIDHNDKNPNDMERAKAWCDALYPQK